MLQRGSSRSFRTNPIMASDSSSTVEQVRPRPLAAALLSFLAPGLGLIYAGRPVGGLIVHAFAILVVLLFIIAAGVFEFFPVFPAFVLATAWLVLCSLTAWHCIDILRVDETRRPRSYDHPLMYALIALMTFVGPLAVTGHFAFRHLVAVVSVDHPTMYPQIHAGDRLWIDRQVYRAQAPRRGDLVAVRLSDSEELAVLRVVAVPSDHVKVHGFTVVVNDELAHYSPLQSHAIASATVSEPSGIEFWVEENHDRQYVISFAPGTSNDDVPRQLQLDSSQFFVLADNRAVLDDDLQEASSLSDSRHFGAIDASQIEGRPTYVAWSTSEDSGSTRWERIGLPLR